MTPADRSLRVTTLVLAIGFAVMLGACSSTPVAPALVGPTAAAPTAAAPTAAAPTAAAPTATEEPLATEAPGNTAASSASPAATPKATKKPSATKKPAATKQPSSGYYKPPGWDGHSDVDCSDFDTQAHAQSFFVGTGGSRTHDPYRLDANHDGVACQSLP